jgi:hypothetical protein
MLSVSGRSNYSTYSARLAKHCNIRYLKEQPDGLLNPYLNIHEHPLKVNQATSPQEKTHEFNNKLEPLNLKRLEREVY